MKHIKKILLVLVLLCLGMVCFQPQKAVLAYDPGYTIEAYDIKIDVAENNVFTIVETISVDFSLASHGIYRTIPTIYTVLREDGSKTKHRTIFSLNTLYYQVNGNEKKYTYHEKTSSSKDIELQIGHEDILLENNVVYTIGYTLNLGQDLVKGEDELYFNLIGDEWGTTIDNVTFSIKMPKDFDESPIGFTWGSYNPDEDTRRVYHTVNNNVISGYFDGVLQAGQALTIRTALEEGYFVGASDNWKDNWVWILYVLPIVLIVAVVVMWFLFGRDDTPIAPVSFYPPEGMNSNDAGYFYRGKVTRESVTSLIVYLAHKGYIKIEETKKDGLFGKEEESFQLIRLKEYDGDNLDEAKFMSSLFAKASLTDPKTKNPIVTEDDLSTSFYLTYDQQVKRGASRSKKDPLKDKKASNCKNAAIIMLGLVVAIAIFMPARFFMEIAGVLVLCCFMGAAIVFCMLNTTSRKTNFIKNIVIISVIFVILLAVLGNFITEYIPYYITPLILVFCGALGTALLIPVLDKRTPYANEMYGKVLGFRNFLESAEKDRLETLVHENPSYYFDILPYAYALNVTDVWMEKFEDIPLEMPDWYAGYTTFSIIRMNTMINRTITSARYSHAPRSSSSSSGGGFSGGGFSGGGHGGGDDGRW